MATMRADKNDQLIRDNWDSEGTTSVIGGSSIGGMVRSSAGMALLSATANGVAARGVVISNVRSVDGSALLRFEPRTPNETNENDGMLTSTSESSVAPNNH